MEKKIEDHWRMDKVYVVSTTVYRLQYFESSTVVCFTLTNAGKRSSAVAAD